MNTLKNTVARTGLLLALSVCSVSAQQSDGGVFGMGWKDTTAQKSTTSVISLPNGKTTRLTIISHEVTPAIIHKMNSKEPLTVWDYVRYIQALENNPKNQAIIRASQLKYRNAPLGPKPWAMIISKLHLHFYGADRAGSGLGEGVLFKKGPEYGDFEKIDLMVKNPRREALDSDGNKINMAHAIAGIASLVNRTNPLSNTVLAAMNTHAGDAVQVPAEVIFGFTKAYWGQLSAQDSVRAAGVRQMKNAPSKAELSQLRGNSIGLYGNSLLYKHRNAKLSKVFARAIQGEANRYNKYQAGIFAFLP